MQITMGKKLSGYYITSVFKPSFHCNSKSASSEGDISLLPEHEKNLNFFEVCLTESSHVQKKYNLKAIFRMPGMTSILFLRFFSLCNIVHIFCIFML